MNNSNMRKIISVIARAAIIIVVVCVVLWQLTSLCERKDSANKYASFFEQQDDFDVIFLGTSHAINAIYPMELWDEQGIVSYNFGGHSNVMATSYWVMENALDYTKPKLVVIDCLNMEANEKTSSYISHVHISLDAFKPSINKFKAVRDLLDDEAMDAMLAEGNGDTSGEKRSFIGLFWDYSVYHSRWKELSKDDFSPVLNCEKGAEARIRVAEPGVLERISPDEEFENTVSMDYLRRTIAECRQRGIEVLLVDLPFPANSIQQMASNTVRRIADEEGVNYINFQDLDVINYDTDFYDEDHVNPSGARKVTQYLGEYIRDNYDIPDRRDDVRYSSWNDDYMAYRFYLLDKIVGQEDLDNYLMMLSDEKNKVAIEIKDASLLGVRPYRELFANLGMDVAGEGTYANYECDGIPESTFGEYDLRVIVSDAASGGIIDESYWTYDIGADGSELNECAVSRAE